VRNYYLSIEQSNEARAWNEQMAKWRTPHQLKSRLKAIRSLIKLNKKLWPDFRTPETDIYG